MDPSSYLAPPATHRVAVLFDITTTTGRPSQNQEREGAGTAAADHVHRAYADTLGRVLEHCEWTVEWTGHPAVRDHSFEPSAVAHLDGGRWLHHTVTSDPAHRDVLTLIVPCTCERGYVGRQLEDENDLLEILADLRGGLLTTCGWGLPPCGWASQPDTGPGPCRRS